MAIYVRLLRDNEQKRLRELAQRRDDIHMSKRARIILLSAQGYTVPQISARVGLHPINVRKWIHRFNAHGVSGLQSGKSPGRPPRFTEEQRLAIIKLAQANPQDLGLPFKRWSLQRLRKYVMATGVVDSISAETIRQILRSGVSEYESRVTEAVSGDELLPLETEQRPEHREVEVLDRERESQAA
ncbi:MAG: helix-turn-helix domain containing protein [Chloroflexi bacterium]|nr:helix-turn-helix domain containing protein [Chloroflexota bacterium]